MANHDLETERRLTSNESDIRHIVADVAEIKESLQALRDIYQKGRGAAWLLFILLPVIGGFISAKIERFLGW